MRCDTYIAYFDTCDTYMTYFDTCAIQASLGRFGTFFGQQMAKATDSFK